MKKFVSVISLVSMVVFVLASFSGAFAAETPNMIPNGSFEIVTDGAPDGFTHLANGTPTTNFSAILKTDGETPSGGGNNYIGFTSNPPSDIGIDALGGFVPGNSYKFTAKYKASTPATARFSIDYLYIDEEGVAHEFEDWAKANLDDYNKNLSYSYNHHLEQADDWKLMSFNFVVPEFVNGIKIFVGKKSAASEVYWDELSIIPHPNIIADGDLETPLYYSGGSLVTGLFGWSDSGSSGRSYDEPAIGDRNIKIARGASNNPYITTVVLVKPATWYKLSFDHYTLNDNPAKASKAAVKVVFPADTANESTSEYYGGSKNLDVGYPSISTLSDLNNWQHYSGYFKTQDVGKFLTKMELRLRTNTTENTIYFDNISLEVAESLIEFSDEDGTVNTLPKEGGDVTIKGTFIPSAPVEQVLFMSALYKEEDGLRTLISLSNTIEETFDNGEDVINNSDLLDNLITTVTVPETVGDEKYIVKGFLWNTWQGLVPFASQEISTD